LPRLEEPIPILVNDSRILYSPRTVRVEITGNGGITTNKRFRMDRKTHVEMLRKTQHVVVEVPGQELCACSHPREAHDDSTRTIDPNFGVGAHPSFESVGDGPCTVDGCECKSFGRDRKQDLPDKPKKKKRS
jgi:hypothetical protein